MPRKRIGDVMGPQAFLPLGRGRVLLAAVMFLLAVVARFATPGHQASSHLASESPEGAVRRPATQANTAVASGDAVTRRVARVGRQLLDNLPPGAGIDFHFRVDEQTAEPRSWCQPPHEIVVTSSLVDALSEDSWLATILSYEIGVCLQPQSTGTVADIDTFVIELLQRTGFPPQVVADMSEWVITSTSLRPAIVTEGIVSDFQRRIAQLVARAPAGAP